MLNLNAMSPELRVIGAHVIKELGEHWCHSITYTKYHGLLKVNKQSSSNQKKLHSKPSEVHCVFSHNWNRKNIVIF